MKEQKLLQEVIKKLEYLEEYFYHGYQSESISGGGGKYEGSYMGYFDKEDRDEMVKKLKEIYNFFETVEKYNI